MPLASTLNLIIILTFMSTIPSATQKIDIFLQWCLDNVIWLDPRLRIQLNSVAGICVYSCEAIPPLISVVHIHKNSVLSVRSCSLSEYIAPILYGPEAQHALSLAIYVEILAGESSRWFGYIQSLPAGTVDLPIFWKCEIPSDRSDDGAEALGWLRGTEVERHMKRQPGNSLKALNDYYFNFAEPLLLRYLEQHDNITSSKPNIQGFYRAYSLVSSRAFLVDAYHGLSMVPVADAFNHEQDNHVHLQTEFNVCADCGSLYECPHDQEINPDCTQLPPPTSRKVTSALIHAENDLDQYYEMVSNAPILPRTEVFNTYGENLNNAQLLTRYGFTLDANENDCVTWDLHEVYQWLVGRTSGDDYEFRQFLSVWNDVLPKAVQDRTFESVDSQLVYFHSEGASGELCLNGDGKISHQLWVLLALSSCLRGKRDGDTIPILKTLKTLLAYQIALESGSETSSDVAEAPPGKIAITSHIADLAHSITDLCLSRKDQLGKEGVGLESHGDISDMLDDLPAEMARTRLAISAVMSELSVLDSCISAWTDITTPT